MADLAQAAGLDQRRHQLLTPPRIALESRLMAFAGGFKGEGVAASARPAFGPRAGRSCIRYRLLGIDASLSKEGLEALIFVPMPGNPDFLWTKSKT